MRHDKEITRSELVDAIWLRSAMPKVKIEVIVGVIFDSITEALRHGDGVEIRGFGTFAVRSHKAYEGRNPRTGATVRVPPKRLPHFRAGKAIAERVDAARGQRA